ncbi:hypothetical protein CPB83DRAFT_852368 [Crepidotus variabilis]|uniref:Uncharacterized protein n=1 Tax=Crepidotus variabilis TaxID=179855 RepID=A0A9P6EIA9_9AGAR|nr:hypothetical protein CPB83DRAFT_852368 [Crepidotus variabilis]
MSCAVGSMSAWSLPLTARALVKRHVHLYHHFKRQFLSKQLVISPQLRLGDPLR